MPRSGVSVTAGSPEVLTKMVDGGELHGRNIKDTSDEAYLQGQNTMCAKVEALVSFSPKRMKDTSHSGAEGEFST